MADSTDIPRRSRLEQNTATELTILEAMKAVEAAGAHPLLTDAVVLLGQAKNKVGDFVDGANKSDSTLDQLSIEREIGNASFNLMTAVSRFAAEGPAERAAVMHSMFHELESQMRNLSPSREVSLAITNLQQAALWWREANRLYHNAEPAQT